MKLFNMRRVRGDTSPTKISGEFTQFNETFCIHRDVDLTKKWAVSHIETGVRVIGGMSTRVLAESGARAMLDIQGEERTRAAIAHAKEATS